MLLDSSGTYFVSDCRQKTGYLQLDVWSREPLQEMGVQEGLGEQTSPRADLGCLLPRAEEGGLGAGQGRWVMSVAGLRVGVRESCGGGAKGCTVGLDY